MSSSPPPALTPRKRGRTPRTVRTRQFKLSNTGTEVAHIETIEADPALRIFPPVLVSQIRTYQKAKAQKGEQIDLTFARSGNTKLNVSGDGYPAYFVVPETNQKLDAGRYRYGLAKQSPLIVVVQEKADSSVSFNGGQPAIILYHGKHSSIEGPDKVSKWAVWDGDGLRSDIMVWRVAEGAKMPKTSENNDQDAQQKLEQDMDAYSVDTVPQIVGDGIQPIFQDPPRRIVQPSSALWQQQINARAYTPVNGPDLQEHTHEGGTSTPERQETMPIDPQLLEPQFNSNRLTVSTYPQIANTVTSPQWTGNAPDLRSRQNQAVVHHRARTNEFPFFACICRGLILERRNAEMAATTEKALPGHFPSMVNLNFRPSITCETRLTKTLEDCRTLSHVFAYGRLYRTILLDHCVISVHFLNAVVARAPLQMVIDDTEHWKTLIGTIQQELYLRDRVAREEGGRVCSLDLVVLDEGY